MKKSILLLFIPYLLWSGIYDPALLQIGAKMFPKITLLEKGTNERINSSLNLVIVASSSNKIAAHELSEMIKYQYGGTLSTHPIAILTVSPKEALEIKNGHCFIFLMEQDDAMLLPLIEYAEKNKILTFSFDPSLLSKGVAISLYIGRSVKPYINLAALKKVPFVFEYGFLKLSQPY